MTALEKRLRKIYKTAERELKIQIDHYYNGWNEVIDGEEIHHAGMYERYWEQFEAFKAGRWTDSSGQVVTDQRVFDQWWYAQEGRGERWESLRDQMAERITSANIASTEEINVIMPAVYTIANNGVALNLKSQALSEGILGIRFDLVDESTVKYIMSGNHNILPIHNVKVDTVKDIKWNKTKLQNALLQGVLQGDSLDHIADRFQAVTNMNRASAIRNARTALTSARNGGKQDRWDNLRQQGVETTKIWVDVHDSVPPERNAHWEAHDQEVATTACFEVGGEKLMFPGDTSHGASGWNIYNCRCSTKTGGVIFHSILDEETRKRANIRVRVV